ncbi:MAG: DUF4173 domain-containing protein [Clostridia bacterium]|nr:DUF4173 domain-containing protein [Clostridia bacterium]
MNRNPNPSFDVNSNTAAGTLVPVGQYQPVQKEKKPQRLYTPGESLFAWFSVFAGYLFLRAFPVSSHPLGAFMFTVLLFTVSAAVLVRAKARITPLCVISALSAIAVSATFVLSSNGSLRVAAYPYVLVTYCYFVYSAAGNSLKRGFCDLIVIDYILSVFVMPFTAIAQIFRAMFGGRLRLNGKLILKILLGIICAAAPTAIVWLLLSYDSGFVEIFNKLLDFKTSDIASHLLSLAFGVPIGMFIFGLYVSSTAKNRERIVTSEVCSEISGSIKIAPVASVVSAFVPLLLIYAVFFASQWKYYLSAFTGVLPENVSYAEYAREGFFQLFAVACINLVMIITATLFARRIEGRQAAAFRILSVIVSLFTLTLIATAAAKMIMYIDAYGLTQLRVYASWAMGVLSIVFVLVALRAFVPKMNLGIVSIAVCVLCFVGLGAVDVDAMIADYNVDAYLDGRLESLDTHSLSRLGDSGIPALAKLYGELANRYEEEELDLYASGILERLEEYLETKKKAYKNDTRGFFATTLPCLRARKVMAGLEIKDLFSEDLSRDPQYMIEYLYG